MTYIASRILCFWLGLVFPQPNLSRSAIWCGDSPSRANYTSVVTLLISRLGGRCRRLCQFWCIGQVKTSQIRSGSVIFIIRLVLSPFFLLSHSSFFFFIILQDCFRTTQRVLGLISICFLLRAEPWRPVSWPTRSPCWVNCASSFFFLIFILRI